VKNKIYKQQIQKKYRC